MKQCMHYTDVLSIVWVRQIMELLYNLRDMELLYNLRGIGMGLRIVSVLSVENLIQTTLRIVIQGNQ